MMELPVGPEVLASALIDLKNELKNFLVHFAMPGLELPTGCAWVN